MALINRIIEDSADGIAPLSRVPQLFFDSAESASNRNDRFK